MDIQKLQDASDVLKLVIENFKKMPESQREAVTAALHCQIAQSYLLDLALSLSRGVDAYDAYLGAAQGTTSVTVKPAD